MPSVVSDMDVPDQTWVVIPAYGEEARIGAVLDDVLATFENVVVVDDGSRDQTRAVAAQRSVWLLTHVFNCGQGAALRTGIEFALRHGAERLVTVDADGQHRAADARALVAALADGRSEVALGSRFLGAAQGMPFSRLLVVKAGVCVTRLLSRVQVTDAHNGLRAMTRAAAERIRIEHDRMAHASEIIDEIRRLDLPFIEVPVTIRYSQQTLQKGQSGWNGLRILAKFLVGKVVR